MPTVYVAGSINMDLVATTERLPRAGETVTGAGFSQHPGGKGANQAVAAAKLGARVVLTGRTGDDAIGAELQEFLRRQAVDVSRVLVTEQTTTGVALITVDAAGQNTIVVTPGSNARFSRSDLGDLPLRPGDVALTQLEIPIDTSAWFFELARARGATTLLNAAPALELAESLLVAADVVVVNELELASFLRLPAPESEPTRVLELAARLRRRTGQTVVVTLGRGGAVAIWSQGQVHVAGHAVEVVDTTGAGDAFVGALAAALADGAPLDSALEKANAAGAFSVGRAGAAEASPSADQLTAWLMERSGAPG